MCDLNGWDGAILISDRALTDLAVALDQSVQSMVESSSPTTVEDFQVNCTELVANLALLVPRVLYATKNTDFNPNAPDYAGADDDLERLHARLTEYGRLTVLGDEGNRLTFVRDQWFDGVSVTPAIELAPNDPDHPADNPDITVRITMNGKVLVGDNFVDGAMAATSADAHDFTMELDYEFQVRDTNFLLPDEIDIGLGSLPFRTLAWPEECEPPEGLRFLPQAGWPVWAQKVLDPDTGEWERCDISDGHQWRLPTQEDINSPPEPDHPPCTCPPSTTLPPTLFTGAPGDCILDPDDASERWLVRDFSREGAAAMPLPANDEADSDVDLADELRSTPRRLLIDTTCNQPVAESGKGHAGLVFRRIVPGTLVIEGVDLTNAERAAINRSIMKLDGFAIGAWLEGLVRERCLHENPDQPDQCPPPPRPQQLAMLALLGEQAMDFAPLPAEFTPSVVPQWIANDGVPYVQSNTLVLLNGATNIFPRAGDTPGVIAVGGMFSDRVGVAPGARLPENFSRGQDLAVGVSLTMLNRWMLPPVRSQLREKLASVVPGFRDDTFEVRVDLADNRLDVTIEGGGTVDLFLFSDDFPFTVRFPLRLRTQPAVLRNACGDPLDAEGDILPCDDLSCIGLNLEEGDVIALSAWQNPLCFLGYVDPRDAHFNPLAVPQPAMGQRPKINASGCVSAWVNIPHPSDEVPRAFLWAEGDFAVPPFPNRFDRGHPELRPGLEVALIPPSEDELHVDVDFDWPLDQLQVLLEILDHSLSTLIHPELRKKIARQTPQQPNIAGTWQVFLQHSDPVNESNDAISIDTNGVCLLFRMIPGHLSNFASVVCQGFGL